MKVFETSLPGVLVLELDRFADQRGSFFESWHKKRYAEHGLNCDFVQDNVSESTKGVLRGLHFQNPMPQGKLTYVIHGEVFDVAVDLRVGSATFGKWYGTVLSFENRKQIYLPEGFAHGFVVLSERAIFGYKCTEYYCKACERTLLWNDPELGIDWPVAAPVLSEKDKQGMLLKSLPHEFFFDNTSR